VSAIQTLGFMSSLGGRSMGECLPEMRSVDHEFRAELLYGSFRDAGI
jgi:hypothetical protein